MPPEYGRHADYIGGRDRRALCLDLCDSFLHVDCIPMGHGIEDQTKRAELFFLTLPQSVADLATISVVNFPRKLMSEFLPVQLDQDTPAELCIIDIVQDMQRFDQASELDEGLCEGGRPISHLQDAHDVLCFQVAEPQRASKADEIFPVFNNDACVDFSLRDVIQGAIVGVYAFGKRQGHVEIAHGIQPIEMGPEIGELCPKVGDGVIRRCFEVA